MEVGGQGPQRNSTLPIYAVPRVQEKAPVDVCGGGGGLALGTKHSKRQLGHPCLGGHATCSSSQGLESTSHSFSKLKH